MTHENNHSPMGAAIMLSISFIAGFFGWIGWTSMEEWLKFVSLLISMAAGIMAIRYYLVATREKNISIKREEEERRA